MTDALTIGQLQIACRAPGAESAHRMASRMTEIAHAELGCALEDALDAAFPSGWRGDGAVVSVHRVVLDLDVDLAADRQQIAKVWARALARAALSAVASGDAVRFDDGSARLAAFVADLVQGRAWSCWYWRDFDGVKLLPLSTALRTVLLRDASHGLAALRRCPPDTRAQILEAMAPSQTRECLDAFVAVEPVRSGAGIDNVAAWAVGILRNPARHRPVSPAHLALEMLCTPDRHIANGAADLGAERLLNLAEALSEIDEDVPGSHAPPTPNRKGNRQLPTSHEPNRVQIGAALRRATAAAVGPLHDPGTQTPGPATDTPFGGAFLLWPHIAALPVTPITAGWSTDLGAPDAVLRWRVLARCFGPLVERRVLNDSLLMRLFAPDPCPAAADILDWTEAQARDADACLPIAWLEAERVTAAHWRQISGLLRVLKGSGQGYWLRVGQVEDHPETLANEALPSPLETDLQDAETLLAPDAPVLVGQLAQIALKRFAYGQPGFANASVAYLQRSFLSMSARTVQNEDAFVAALGPVPLAILLNLTGAGRMSYALPGGETVRLVQGGG